MLPSGVNRFYSRWEYKQEVGPMSVDATTAITVDPGNAGQLQRLGRRGGHLLGQPTPTRYDAAVRGYHDELLAAAALGTGCPCARHRLRLRSDVRSTRRASSTVSARRGPLERLCSTSHAVRAAAAGLTNHEVPPSRRPGPPVPRRRLRRRAESVPAPCLADAVGRVANLRASRPAPWSPGPARLAAGAAQPVVPRVHDRPRGWTLAADAAAWGPRALLAQRPGRRTAAARRRPGGPTSSCSVWSTLCTSAPTPTPRTRS